ncbi:MAG: hypothetical protein JO141_05080 [Bradyrhizobium sp.]|nr:hypothetical protein [Alphaproteobacteria bacterium]MBV9456876.1 hypothetical protein [Bradyrhizobium sp.]
MRFRFEGWTGDLTNTWSAAAASFALVAIVFTATTPRKAVAVAEPIATVTAVEDAAAGVTFKIVTVDAMSPHVTWAPLTGDGSN